jgi:hypothetical protein
LELKSVVAGNPDHRPSSATWDSGARAGLKPALTGDGFHGKTAKHRSRYLIAPSARSVLSSLTFNPKIPPSTSSVCWPRAGESLRMLAGVFDI